MIAAARWLMLVIALAGVLLDVLVLAGVTRGARMGLDLETSLATQRFDRVVRVEPGSPAERAGIQRGDRLRFATPADAAVAAAGVRDTVVRLARSDGAVVPVTLAPIALDLSDVLFLLLGAAMGVLAVLLALRAWSDVQARWLAAGFVWFAYFVAPIDAVAALGAPLNGIADLVIGPGMAALAFFATGWDATPAVVRRTVRPAAVVLAILYGIVNRSGGFALLDGRAQLVGATMLFLTLTALVIGGLATSARRATGSERRRIGWMLVTMTVTFAPWFVYEALLALRVVEHPWTSLAFTSFALPLGFGYAMLRHRVVDIGFALNRAAVFAATTAVLVGVFGALQWATDQFLEQATRAQGFAIQMAVTVLVLYALRALRAQADALVAHVFFAKRQRRIDAIRSLAKRIDAVEAPASLAPYIVGQLRAEAAIAAAVYVEDDVAFARVAGDGGPAFLARDDAAIVSLRATGEPVAVCGDDRDAPIAIAYPMAVRGRLRGALVCALPAREDDVAPDERAALADLAARACIVREDLLAEQLRAELGKTRVALARLTGGGVPSLGSAG